MKHVGIATAWPRFERRISWALIALSWCSTLSAAPTDAAASEVAASDQKTTERKASDAELAQVERYAARAFEAYHARDYAGAVVLYRKAFDVAPRADLLYNIARVYDNGLGDRALAIDYYGRYLAHPGAAPERIEKAHRRIAELGASQQAPLAALPPRAVRTAPPSEAMGAQAPADAGGASSMRGVGLACGAAGLAALGLGSLFGLGAMSDTDTAHAECDGDRCRSQRGVDAAKSASRQASVATLAFSLAGVLLGTGAVLWLTSPNPPSPAPGAHSQLRWAPSATASEIGVQLNGLW